MENYPGNSNRATSKTPPNAKPKPKAKEEKKVEKVVVGTVTRRKKPLGKRFSETFVTGDAESVFAYVLNDVMIPAAKDMVADAFTQGVERMLFGDSRGRSRVSTSKPTGSGYTSYNRMSPAAKRPDPRQDISRRARATHNFDEIILDTRHEAQEVIDQLFSLVSEYDVATVADLYEMVGQTGDFIDEKWGWVDMRGAGVTRVKGGYLLDLPRPEPID